MIIDVYGCSSFRVLFRAPEAIERWLLYLKSYYTNLFDLCKFDRYYIGQTNDI